MKWGFLKFGQPGGGGEGDVKFGQEISGAQKAKTPGQGVLEILITKEREEKGRNEKKLETYSFTSADGGDGIHHEYQCLCCGKLQC